MSIGSVNNARLAVAVALAAFAIGTNSSTAEVPGPRTGDERAIQRRLDEADMLARARAERSVQDGLRIENNAADAASDDGEDIRTKAIDAEVLRRLSEAERDAELDELSARLKSRAPRSAAQSLQPAPPPIQVAPQPMPPAAQVAESRRATVILAMTPGYTGIRRNNPTADPILCIGFTCWISRGASEDARSLPRSRALGAVNTLGDRAGACNTQTSCVFRNVDLGGSTAVIQPIDLRVLRHDRRAPMTVGLDRTCTVSGGEITCPGASEGPDYRVWLIDEQMAQSASPRTLSSFAARNASNSVRQLATRRY